MPRWVDCCAIFRCWRKTFPVIELLEVGGDSAARWSSRVKSINNNGGQYGWSLAVTASSKPPLPVNLHFDPASPGLEKDQPWTEVRPAPRSHFQPSPLLRNNMVKVKEDCEQSSGGQPGNQQSNNNNNSSNPRSHHHGTDHEGKIPRSGTSNLATQHFHYHWSYPTAGPIPTGQATFHFGPGFEPQTAPNQHVVYFHVNPGVTVSFQMGDNVQTIKGPMTVPMVSTNSSPPIAMPVQVPHGHVVQQIVDESGTLRHVILSPQHPPLLPLPQHFGAGNPSGSNQPQGFYPGAMPHGYHSFSPLPAGVLGHGPPQGHSPPPHSFHKDERSQKQYNKLKKKLEAKQLREHPLNTTPPLSPRKELNGNSRKGVSSVGTSEDGEESSSLQDEEEDVNLLTELLGNINVPQVSEVMSRTALVQWSAPKVDNPQGLNYEVLLSDRCKEGKYKSIYSGAALSCRIEDLKPGTEYLVCVSARLDNVVGCASEPTLFTTPPCKPDPPPAPKLSGRNRHSLTLKWLAAKDNGSPIERYIIESELNGNWTEISQSKNKQTVISKLQPATSYTFRIAAINQFGKSDYSPSVEYHTCDSPPPQPLPVTLTHSTPTTLTLQWQARPQDDEFTLQMEDPDSDHGYLAAYSGKETSYTCHGLKKNSLYKFRLKSQNEDGVSRWSEEAFFSTLPGRPGPPGRPQQDGKMHGQRCKLKWEPPYDKGGSTITNYTLEISKIKDGAEFKTAYRGALPACTIERLEPGSKHSVRVCCEGPGGVSDFSEVAIITTDPICPGQCQPPRLHGKPKPHSIHIKWNYPESDGGSPITEMEVAMCKRVEGNEELVTAYKGKETECIVNDLCPAQNYALTVRAINKVGRGPWSNPLKVTSGNSTPSRPSAPNLSLSPGAVSCSWTAPDHNGSPITQYILQMTTPPCENYTSVFSGLSTQCDVKLVPPATLCVFRLQAVNSLGSSSWSELSTIMTSPSSPGSVTGLKSTATPTSISLSWGLPVSNGDPVTHYIVDTGDSSTTVTETNCVIENLSPATTYRIRVRGVNGVGPGSVSSLRVSTLPLPPQPPQLSCTTVGHNYLKLRWGLPNSNVNNYTFTVAMTSPSSRRTVVYEGTNTICKVSRLQEQTSYNFTITSANTTGKGPESEVYTFTTCIAPPPYVKGLKATNVSHRSCTVEWAPLRPQGNDSIEYTVQCARLREQVFKQVYHGRDPHCDVKDLDAGAEYLFRVCAVRQSPKGPVEGSYCQNINVSTPPIHHENPPQHCVRTHNHQAGGNRPLTDQQWAGIILSVFIVLAVLVAIIIAHSIY
ncbi:fibronectin type-III domain-containing protein 3A isoform X2 [Cimex lectularius]|uniref:Fibronectin type-III domain-containing protein n=1 Tax=Cimex lectularius TaxID=79782 RepID=A0A8I6RZZ5_CIMLE|nr:fibronectin type-III domain-containing protein 3A isoform X2 [Cimex lectularius]